jgi:hypothetical protein
MAGCRRRSRAPPSTNEPWRRRILCDSPLITKDIRPRIFPRRLPNDFDRWPNYALIGHRATPQHLAISTSIVNVFQWSKMLHYRFLIAVGLQDGGKKTDYSDGEVRTRTSGTLPLQNKSSDRNPACPSGSCVAKSAFGRTRPGSLGRDSGFGSQRRARQRASQSSR